MTFIGKSRQDVCGPWNMYVCLNGGECKSMLPIVIKWWKKPGNAMNIFGM